MQNRSIWMVRAGRGAEYVDDFLGNGLVAIGFGRVELGPNTDKATIEARIAAERPGDAPGKITVAASQLKRYYDEVAVGDSVTTYDPGARLYYLGQILSDVEVRDDTVLHRARKVKWTRKVLRNALQTSTRNTLGAILTLFLIKDDAAEDMWRNSVAIDSEITQPNEDTPFEPTESGDERELTEEVVAKAEEFIQDRIAKLDWEQMQELVAEILIAMGYRARVSKKGADRGRDIFASPDGLGLQEPRIFVEVKHRAGTQMGSQEIRAFLGGRQPGDRCLYVSTGGFSKDAHYEAERSSVPITLITLQELQELLVEHYENMRPTGTALVPLERVYWPA